MRELTDSMPMATALALAAVIGIVIGALYELRSGRKTRSHGFGINIAVSIAGALVGAWVFANYLALAMTSLLVVWLLNRFTPDSIR
jgi:uncharacterized membrane protein YeaQ/YmgE (transglycosylase-associated protein family)